jgi:ABC-2 type transport system ATP-binding protein
MLDHMAVLKGIADAKEPARRWSRACCPGEPVGRAQEGHRRLLGRHAPALRHRPGPDRRSALIIVDEPTAGLDPEERNRFLNLLAEIGENVVVILSTHIVEDVSDLCPAMAIICDGRIVREGAPADLVARA